MTKIVRKCHYTISTAVLHVCLRKKHVHKYCHILYFTEDHCFLLVHRTKGQCSFNEKIINIYTSVKYSPISYFLNLPFNRAGFSRLGLKTVCRLPEFIACFSVSHSLWKIPNQLPLTEQFLHITALAWLCSLQHCGGVPRDRQKSERHSLDEDLSHRNRKNIH